MAKHLSTDQHRKGHWGTEAWSFSLAREFLFNISSIYEYSNSKEILYIHLIRYIDANLSICCFLTKACLK